MAYASKAGRARTDPRYPSAYAICDRCGFTYNHSDLQQQTEYGGTGLITFNILVCCECLDTPQPQLKALALPADPQPVRNPRIPDYQAAETDYHTTTEPPLIQPFTGIQIPQGDKLLTEDGKFITKTPIGNPQGLAQGAIMSPQKGILWGQPVPVLSITSNGTDQVTVTCFQPHNLSTNSQISVEGLINSAADGFYSVVVTTATAFTYQTFNPVPSASLLQGSTRIVTAIVGLPRGYETIVQTE